MNGNQWDNLFRLDFTTDSQPYDVTYPITEVKRAYFSVVDDDNLHDTDRQESSAENAKWTQMNQMEQFEAKTKRHEWWLKFGGRIMVTNKVTIRTVIDSDNKKAGTNPYLDHYDA